MVHVRDQGPAIGRPASEEEAIAVGGDKNRGCGRVLRGKLAHKVRIQRSTVVLE